VACRRALQTLIEKYDWALLQEHGLVEWALGSTQSEGPPTALEK
jgi:hypothetical protein